MPDGEEVLDRDENGSEEESEVTTETEAEKAQEPAKEPEKAPERQEPRKVWTMPVEKAQEEKRRAAEKARQEAEEAAEERISALRAEYEAKLAKAAPDDSDRELEEVAKKYNLEPDAAKELARVIAKKAAPAVPDLSKYDEILREREIEGMKSEVSREIDEKVVPLILKDNPNATPEFIREAKGRIAELAFTEGYNGYRVEDIYRVKAGEFDFKDGYAAEPGGGRSGEMLDFSKVTPEQEIELADRDPETYRKLLAWQSSNESRFTD